MPLATHANVPSATSITPGAQDHACDQHVPRVRLSGLWLEQLGFAIGTKLRITASEGQLLMQVLPPVEVPARACSVRR